MLKRRVLKKYFKKIKKNKFKTIFIFLLILISSVYLKSDQKKKYNLLVICNNCFNKNRIGVYNKNCNNTPYIDKFAQNSFIFNNLISSATYTSPCLYETVTAKLFELGSCVWHINSIPNFSFNLLKKHGYTFNYPEFLFGKTFSEDKKIKEPFIILDHPNDLHEPYSNIFKKKYNSSISLSVSHATKEIEKFAEGLLVHNYRTLFGIPWKFYAHSIENWNEFIEYSKNDNSIQYKLMKNYLNKKTFSEISSLKNENELSAVHKKNILSFLNSLMILNSKLLHFITYKNNILKYGNIHIECNSKKLNGIHRTIALRFMYINELKYDNTATIDKNGKITLNNISQTTNYNKYNLLYFYLCVVSDLFRSTERSIVKRVKLADLDLKNKGLYNDLINIVKNDIILNKFGTIIKYAFNTVFHIEFDLEKIFHQGEKQKLRAFYDENITEFDKRFGSIIDNLKRNGLYENTVIVLMGDHGEALYEHNEISHGTDILYNEIISPPLIIHIPGKKGKTVINDIVRMVDIMPTLIEAIGFDPKNIIKHKVDGKSFYGLFNNKYNYNETAYTVGRNHGYSIIKHNGWKLIYNTKTENKKLFDILKDPKEKYDMSFKHPEILADMESEIIELIDRINK
jgi:phosphopentomutase